MNIDKKLGFEELAKIMSGDALFDKRKIKFYTDTSRMSRKTYESRIYSSYSFYRKIDIPFQISYGTDDSRGVLGLLHIDLTTGGIYEVSYKLYRIDRYLMSMVADDRSGILGTLEKALSSLVGRNMDLENYIIEEGSQS
jgi:hypothetical protein